MKKNIKKILIIVIIIVVVLILLYFLVFKKKISTAGKTNYEIPDSMCLSATILESSGPIEVYSNNKYSGEDYKRIRPTTITVENICNKEISYNLSLKEIDSNLGENKLKYTLDDKKTYDLKDDMILTTDTLKKGESKTYNVRLWLGAKNTESTAGQDESVNTGDKVWSGEIVALRK